MAVDVVVAGGCWLLLVLRVASSCSALPSVPLLAPAVVVFVVVCASRSTRLKPTNRFVVKKKTKQSRNFKSDCAVCSSGFAGGISNGCHECSEAFRAGMYFLAAVGAAVSLVFAWFLFRYLVRREVWGGEVGGVSVLLSSEECFMVCNAHDKRLTYDTAMSPCPARSYHQHCCAFRSSPDIGVI